MIIVMTNRNLTSVPQLESIDISVKNLGVNLGAKVDGKDRVYTGAFFPDEQGKEQYKKITIQPKGEEAAIFENISAENLAKPWVFFVHGFHQDPIENIDKAIALQENHQVNVVVFAWPSRPLDKTIGWSDVGKSAALDLLKGTPIARVVTKHALNLAKAELADRWENYSPAQENARKSDIDLMAALTLVNKQLKSVQPPVLLIHSMGNYLLENGLKKLSKLPMNFNNIILHQADVTVPGYEWVYKLSANLINENNARLYVTSNLDDYILLASKGRRAILKKQGELPENASTERLGRYIENHIEGDIHYLDFTCGPDVDDKHEFFKFSNNTVNDHIHACLGRIFRAEGDELPNINGNSNSGFTKMPMAAHVYRLEYVFHLVDYVEGKEENEVRLVTSLSQFDDGKGLKYEDDPDFDDYG